MITNKNNIRNKRNGKKRSPNSSSSFIDDRVTAYSSPLLTDSLRLPPRVDQVITCTKTALYTGGLVQSAAFAATYTPVFTVSALVADITTISGVFDQYKINMIEIIFKPRANMAPVATANTGQGQLFTVLDYDDNTALTSVTAAENYSNCITSEYYQQQRRCFRPRIAVAAYGNGAFSSYANVPAPWIDMSSLLVPHYGVKAIVDLGTTNYLQTYDITWRCNVSFRSTR
jgi:hypothetical protein